MSLNDDQKDYMGNLDSLPRAALCPCGWHLEKDCVKRCSTGTRTSAPALVSRIKEIYRSIDQHTGKDA